MKVISYIRTSTADQLSMYGPERQRQAIAAWARQGQRRIVAEVVDDVSGKVSPFARDGWRDAVEAACSGLAVGIVVADLSRLSRDLIEQEQALREMAACNTRLFSTSSEEQRVLDDPDDPQRKLIRQIVGSVNEYDRAMIVARMQAGRRIKKAGGGYAGGQPPFGYQGGNGSKELAPNAREQEVLTAMKRLHRKGMPTRAIAAALNADGLFNRKGGNWASASVARLIKRETRVEMANARW